MKSKEEIIKALQDMETRRKAYVLDMYSSPKPNEIVYNTEIIRKMEVTDAIIHGLRWVLGDDAPAIVTPCSKCKDGECSCEPVKAG